MSRITKAVMLLAAFAMAFALVCPVAVTPIFVTSHHSPHLDLALVPAHVLLVVLALHAVLLIPERLAVAHPVDPTVRNCVRLC